MLDDAMSAPALSQAEQEKLDEILGDRKYALIIRAVPGLCQVYGDESGHAESLILQAADHIHEHADWETPPG